MINQHTKIDCTKELRDASLKATPARLSVLELFEKADKPLDVSTIIDYLKRNNIKADPVTAFRIINLFTEKGLIKQISFNEGKFRYELTSKSDHHHFICDKCGSIEDISDCHIDELEKEINNKKGLVIKRHSLEFFGICKLCQL